MFSHRCQNLGFYSLHLSTSLIFALNINLCPLGWHEMGQEGGNEGVRKRDSRRLQGLKLGQGKSVKYFEQIMKRICSSKRGWTGCTIRWFE